MGFIFLAASAAGVLDITCPEKKTGWPVGAFFDQAANISRQRPAKKAWITRRNLFGWLAPYPVLGLFTRSSCLSTLCRKAGKKIKTVRSFLIAADISFSMAQTDWVLNGKRTTRWDAVKNIMKDFVQHRKSDQIGLVMFGTHAYLQAPLTTDLDAISWLLDQTRREDGRPDDQHWRGHWLQHKSIPGRYHQAKDHAPAHRWH